MLKGIETQTMITRTTDFVREADAQQRKNDVLRDQSAVQTQIKSEQAQQQVVQTLNSQEAAIQRDRQGGGQGREEEQTQAEEDTIEQDGILVDDNTQARMPRGTYVIDIKV